MRVQPSGWSLGFGAGGARKWNRRDHLATILSLQDSFVLNFCHHFVSRLGFLRKHISCKCTLCSVHSSLCLKVRLYNIQCLSKLTYNKYAMKPYKIVKKEHERNLNCTAKTFVVACEQRCQLSSAR